jgi:hypothetical protein
LPVSQASKNCSAVSLIELISGSFGGLNGYRSEVRGLGVEEATHVRLLNSG